ncbi:hypothetical protein EGW08_003955 [Elysia chlorotica]|uniref:Endonuclease/exonuclease/phosphatase domain-containing protein n=1 Tax=Elysia chlorotica TaxID=188477 RepID=A0A3S1BTD2_ELYCH|nr:hypothetical protein EGW08_003955 [Elysia chlorotica]
MEVEPEETKEKGSSKADEEAKGETPDQPKTQEKSEDTVESMDTAEVEANVSSPKKKTESPAKAKNTTPAKKRKLEEDEEEAAAKRLKTVEPEPTEIKDLSDYVMVNKEDVPAADSKEVLDCVPKLPEEPVMETDDAASRVFVPPSKDGGPIIVPLTEAELAKQYTQVPVDRDEASSILVEVGSESAADTTSMSVRSLDVSDAVSMDSISTGDDAATAPGQRVANPSAGGNSVPSAAAPVKQDTAEETGGASAKEEVKASPMKEDAKKSSEQQEITNSPAKEVKSSPAKEGISASPAQQKKSSTVNQNNVQQVNNIPIPAQSQTASAVEASPAQPSPALGATTDAGATHIAKNGTHSPSKENNTSQVSSQDVISKSPVKPAAQPNNLLSSSAIDSRKFVLNPAFPLELMDPAFCFSVVSYNILAECHWKRQDYSYTPSEYMEQGYRHSVLLKELDYLEGDIVCMQEVDPKYYKDTLLPAMTSRGYSGSFIKRTQDYFDEGEATFVKNSRFNIKHSEGISLKELAYKEIDESGLSAEVSAAVKEYLDRSDVIMLSQLECVKTGKMLTVANIHVVYSRDAPDVQCIEIACAIKQLVSKAGSDLNPYIICGDFNCKTTMPGYQLAKDGYLSDDHIRTLQNLEALKNTDGSSRSLIHHLWKAFQHTSSNLKSAYEVTMSKEPVLTSYTNKTHGCLDYVFYSSASLDTVGVLETLDESVLTKNGGIPEVNIPSDHLSLKAVFRMK